MKLAFHMMKYIFPVQATCRSIPIVLDAERKREGLDELLSIATYVVCPAKFPQARVHMTL